MTEAEERVLQGYPPVPNQTYLEKQPNLSLFCKPKIIAPKPLYVCPGHDRAYQGVELVF